VVKFVKLWFNIHRLRRSVTSACFYEEMKALHEAVTIAITRLFT